MNVVFNVNSTFMVMKCIAMIGVYKTLLNSGGYIVNAIQMLIQFQKNLAGRNASPFSEIRKHVKPV